jgi:hypothetical protein
VADGVVGQQPPPPFVAIYGADGRQV